MGAGAILRWRVVTVLAVGVEAILVVVELRVLDDEAAARVGAGVAEGVMFRPDVVENLVALPAARADVEARVVEIAGVSDVPRAAVPVAREDPVLRGAAFAVDVRARGGQVGAPVVVAADLAGVGPAVPPDLVAGVAAAVGGTEEVAGGEVPDRDIACPPALDAVATEPLATRRLWPEGLVSLVRATRRTRRRTVDDRPVA